MAGDENKKIDDAWKEAVQKEKKEEPVKAEGDFTPPEATFSFFVTTLGMQASIFLGDLSNPATNKQEVNLEQAKFLIDTLDVLKEKTKGNLNQEEGELLENFLYELRMRYVEKSK